MKNDILSKIEGLMPTFSKGQKLIGRFIVDHYEKASFMTAAKLGKTVGTSESTVVRFAVELGFDGYPQFQKSLQAYIRTKLTTVQRMEISGGRMGGDILGAVLSGDIDKIRLTRDALSREDFEAAVDMITDSRAIYILGVRSSSALAAFLSFYFNLIFPNVRLIHTTSVSEMFEQVLHVGAHDLVIGISFPRYSRRTVKALQYAKSRGANVLAITDSLSSPLVKYADRTLTARGEMVSFVDSLVAPMSLINALIIAVSMRKKNEAEAALVQLETIWEEYKVYEKEYDE